MAVEPILTLMLEKKKKKKKRQKGKTNTPHYIVAL